MPTNPANIEVALTQQFQKDLRFLSKRYRHIRTDLQPLVEKLLGGELPGNQIAGIKSSFFKVRLKNSDIQKGKSAGYRVIYYLKTQNQIILITIYSKSDRADIDKNILRDIILQYEQEH